MRILPTSKLRAKYVVQRAVGGEVIRLDGKDTDALCEILNFTGNDPVKVRTSSPGEGTRLARGKKGNLWMTPEDGGFDLSYTEFLPPYFA